MSTPAHACKIVFLSSLSEFVNLVSGTNRLRKNAFSAPLGGNRSFGEVIFGQILLLGTAGVKDNS
jgi:hypothetical protein